LGIEAPSLFIGRIKANLKILAAGEEIWGGCVPAGNAARFPEIEQNPPIDGAGLPAWPLIPPGQLDKAPVSPHFQIKYPAAE